MPARSTTHRRSRNSSPVCASTRAPSSSNSTASSSVAPPLQPHQLPKATLSRSCTLWEEADVLNIGGREFGSRLLVGTGKYRSSDEMLRAIAASGAEVVTVAVRRVNLDRKDREGILHHLGSDQYFLLANTAGCYSADEAIR